MKRTAAWGLVALCLLVTSGCVFIGSVEAEKACLPKDAKKVAGGYEISYLVPEDGTIMLIDQKTNKHILTRSLTAGTTYNFSVENVDQQQYKKWGIDLNKANFVLYYYPKNPVTEPAQAVPAVPAVPEQ